MRILVIEDNRDILANVLDYLQLKGFSVDCAQDGLSGLHLASSGHYDLIVLDIMLPGIDGYQVCKRLREDGRSEVPILMLTARDALDDRLQGLNAGADDYLIKPFALSELVARIEVFCAVAAAAANASCRSPISATTSIPCRSVAPANCSSSTRWASSCWPSSCNAAQRWYAVKRWKKPCGATIARTVTACAAMSINYARYSTSPFPHHCCTPSTASAIAWRRTPMLSKQPFQRRILIAFVLMTVMVSGLFSLSIDGVVHFIEEHLVSRR